MNGERLRQRIRRLLPGALTLLMLAWIAFIVVLIADGAKPRP